MFERFDDVDVPDQWDEIAARAAGPSGPAFEPGGHRMAILVAAAAAVLGIAGVLWVGLGDSDDDLATVGTPADTIPETAPPATTAPPTTAPPTTVEVTQPPDTTAPVATVAETATPETSEPPTTAPPETAFECTEIPGDPNAVYANDPALERFGPLGPVPALDITIGGPEPINANLDVARLHGGTAILRQTGQLPGWSVTVVNDDGSIRWRRCGQTTEVWGMIPTAQGILLEEHNPPVTSSNINWRVLDLSTGADAGRLDVPVDYSRVAGDSTHLLFMQSPQYDASYNPVPVEPGEMMRMLDIATMAMSEVPYPPSYYSHDGLRGWIEFAETAGGDGGWILKEHLSEYHVTEWVFVDGAWSDDPAVLRSVVPITPFGWATAPHGDGWSGFDPLGDIVWTLPELGVVWDEGPVWREDGDIVLLGACFQYEAELGCTVGALIGVDRTTGTMLWQLPGRRQFVAVDDGYALLSDGTANGNDDPAAGEGWLMIDTATGEPVDGQLWPDHSTFQMGYSLEEDGMSVGRSGGVVWAVNGDHVRVWFPAALSTGTVSVSLTA